MAMGPGTTFTNGSGHSTAPHTNGVHLNGSSQEPQVHDGDELEPIAVVGLSLRFPQDAVSEDALWKMLVEKRCASTEFPKDRVNIDAFYNADSSVTSKVCINATNIQVYHQSLTHHFFRSQQEELIF